MVVLALSSLLGCGTDSPPAVERVADTLRVHSESSVWDNASLEEVLRIGELEGPLEYVFRDISMFAVAPSGDVFIAELEGDVRQFGPDGRFIRYVARAGQGPGEVRYVVAMDVGVDGQLALVDFGNQRISIYSPEGDFLRQIRRPAGRPGYGRDGIQWDRRGGLWIALHPPRAGPDTLGASLRPTFGRLDSDGEVVDTVFLPARAWDGCERRRPAYQRGFFEDSRIPYLRFAQWGRSRDGTFVFGCSARYEVDVVESNGGVVRISRRWKSPVMSDEEHAFWSENWGPVPKERPAFLRLWVSEDGRIWVWPGAAGSSRPATPEQRERGFPERLWTYYSATDGFDVFEPGGEWLGHVRTPEEWGASPYPGLRDPQFIGDTVWALTTDEYDATYLSKFVVRWGSVE
ncbi:MAG: hypothetical protein AMXMBFR53_31150 [Gemmatimonadota bacterium]